MDIIKIKELVKSMLKKADSSYIYKFINEQIKKEDWNLTGIDYENGRLWSIGFEIGNNKKISINFQLKELWDFTGEPIHFKDMTDLKQMIKEKKFHTDISM